MDIHVPSAADLPRRIAEYVAPLADQAIAERGRFTVALSGGSMPKVLGGDGGLASLDTDWSKWFVFFSDERCVDWTHEDSNYKACAEHFLSKVGIPDAQIYKNDASVPPDQAAVAYGRHVANVFGDSLPSFDLMMLGMGPDGHCASLFPGHSLVKEDQLHVASITDSPKPPPERITLTLPVLNNSKHVCFIATGDSKAALLPEILLPGTQSQLPSALVRPASGNLHWFIDDAAAAQLRLSPNQEVHRRTRLAVVTGANKGIGYHCAKQLKETLGAEWGEVMLTSRNEALGLEAQAALAKEGVHVAYHQLDISKPESADTLAEHILSKYGGLDM